MNIQNVIRYKPSTVKYMKKTTKTGILLTGLFCCLLIPNGRAIDKIEDTFLWELGFSNDHTILLDRVKDGEIITWQFETYDDSFEVSILLSKVSGYYSWICNSKTKESGRVTLTENTALTFHREESVEGYITIIIENPEEISSFPLLILFGIIGLVVITKIKRIKSN